MTVYKDIEKLKAKHAAELAEAEKLNALIDALPFTADQIDKVHPFDVYADMVVKTTPVETMAEAWHRMETTPGLLGLYLLRDTFASFVPETSKKITALSDEDFADIELVNFHARANGSKAAPAAAAIGPAYAVIDGLRHHTEERTLHWYAKLDDGTVITVRQPVTEQFAIRRWETVDQKNSEPLVRKTAVHHDRAWFTHSLVYAGTDHHPGKAVLYGC